MDLYQFARAAGRGQIVERYIDHENDTDYDAEPDALAAWVETKL